MITYSEMAGLSEMDLVRLAKSAKEEKVLNFLSDSIFPMVRKAVTRNANVTEKILNKLSRDTVQNVSFWACKNGKCTTKREFNTDHPCVNCTRDEEELSTACLNCSKIKAYRFSA